MLRKILLSLCLLVGIALVGVLIGWLLLQQQLDRRGLEQVDWQGLRLERSGLRLDRLQLLHRDAAGGRLAVSAQALRLQFTGLAVERLHIQHLDLDWQPATAESPATPPPPAVRLDDLRALLALAPRQAAVDTWHLTLPCQQARCALAGQLRWQRPTQATAAEAVLDLQQRGHRLTVEASLSASAPEADLLLRVLADGNPRLESRHRLNQTSEGLDWRGSLALVELPEAAWLIDWLTPWTSVRLADLPAIPQQMRLGASWAVQLPDTSFARAAGELQAALHLPAPWPVPGVGLIQGDLNLAARGTAGQWRPTGVDGALHVWPKPEHLAAIAPSFRPNSVQISVKPAASEQPAQALRLALTARSAGPLALTLDAAEVDLSLAPLSVRCQRAELQISAKALVGQTWRARAVDGRLAFALDYRDGEFSLTGQSGSRLRAAGLSDPTQPGIELRGADLNLAALALSGNSQTGTWSASLRPTLRIERLDHPLLRAQGWQWTGEIAASAAQTTADGNLRNDAGLAAQTQLQWRADSAARLTLRLDELFLRAGNPLAATAADWPEALTINQGRLRADAVLTMSAAAPVQARLQVDARSLGGIFDRSEFSGLTGQAELSVKDQRLRLALDALRIEQLNPGLALGPLTFAGSYQAPLTAPLTGTLDWREARLRVLGGELRARPGQQPLDGPAPVQQVSIDGLELAELLAAYPAEGLSGEGTLDGELQLRYTQGKLIVEQGQVSARSAGTLRFDSARIAALGRANPAMQLVNEALRNFRFDLLSSDIRYDENGLLRLGVRLHGRNPELERGRPVHFNINLEEDIPALLTSLQLSDRVSEIIQRRVQERLRQPGSRPPP